MPGWSHSQSATVSAVRSASRSIGLRVVVSTTTAEVDMTAAECDVVDAKDADLADRRSCRPPVGGYLGSRRPRGGPPALPASANPTAPSITAGIGVRRATAWSSGDLLGKSLCRTVEGVAEEPACSEIDQDRMATDRGIGELPTIPRMNPGVLRPSQRGHVACLLRDRTSMQMIGPIRRTSRRSTPSRCGSQSIPPSSAYPRERHLPTSVQVSDTSMVFTESAPDPVSRGRRHKTPATLHGSLLDSRLFADDLHGWLPPNRSRSA